MAHHPKGAPGATVTVDRAALRALKGELAGERETARRLQQELVRESEFARKAAEQTLEARAQREEYRRVLAAAVANEKRALQEVEHMRAEVTRLEQAWIASERGCGDAQGRAQELADQLAAARTEAERALAQVHDRAWADAQARGSELQRLEHERGVALGQVRELLGRVPADAPASVRLAARRARLCLGSAAFALVMFLVFFAPFVTVVFTDGSPAWPSMTLGLSAWTLTGVELGLLLTAVGLATWGLRDLRGVERATRQALDRASRDGAGSEVRTSSAV